MYDVGDQVVYCDSGLFLGVEIEEVIPREGLRPALRLRPLTALPFQMSEARTIEPFVMSPDGETEYPYVVSREVLSGRMARLADMLEPIWRD